MIKDSRYYWSHLKTASVTVRVSPKKKNLGIVFRVGNMIDLGNGRQTVMLEHVDYPNGYCSYKNASCDDIPFSMGRLDFIYTSRARAKVQDVNDLLSYIYKNNNIERIVEEVISPGDILVFKKNPSSGGVKLLETLRIVKENAYIKSNMRKTR